MVSCTPCGIFTYALIQNPHTSKVPMKSPHLRKLQGVPEVLLLLYPTARGVVVVMVVVIMMMMMMVTGLNIWTILVQFLFSN